MQNTTLSVTSPQGASDPCYIVTTDLASLNQTTTQVHDARTGRLIAIISRRVLFPDTVTFSNYLDPGKPIGIRKWLQKCKLPDGYPAHEMKTSRGTWVWKSDPVHRLGLYTNNRTEQCVAYLQPASATHPLTLFLNFVAEPFRDEIVVACLILEQRLRVIESNIKVADGKFDLNRSVLGYYPHT